MAEKGWLRDGEELPQKKKKMVKNVRREEKLWRPRGRGQMGAREKVKKGEKYLVRQFAGRWRRPRRDSYMR